MHSLDLYHQVFWFFSDILTQNEGLGHNHNLHSLDLFHQVFWFVQISQLKMRDQVTTSICTAEICITMCSFSSHLNSIPFEFVFLNMQILAYTDTFQPLANITLHFLLFRYLKSKIRDQVTPVQISVCTDISTKCEYYL